MPTPDGSPTDPAWFRALLDTADDVYFRYSLVPARGFVYLSPSVDALTGHAPQAFIEDPTLCLGLMVREDRRILRQVLRSRRGLSTTVRVRRGGSIVPVRLRTVAVVRGGRVVAFEGVARVSSELDDAREAAAEASSVEAPVPQRLAALMYEVHALLHQVVPDGDRRLRPAGHVVRLGALTLDLERLSVEESGRAVVLTSRELMVLRYLLMRPDRVVTRQQLLQDVWGYQYTGDDRTIDVHVSRLRRKLPSLASRLIAVKHVGYRLESDDAEVSSAS